MKNYLIYLAACLAGFAAHAQYNSANLSMPADETQGKYTWKNMRIYPVFAKESFVNANANVGKYTTLSEALKQKKVQITEAKEGEEVNKLFAENTSGDTVIIIGGEVISGGKQDRMIASDVILPPRSGKVDLSVFCVEHGRWTYRGARTSNEGANESKAFRLSYSVGSTKMRKAASVNKNQAEVWDKVSEITTVHDAASPTGAYTALSQDSTYQNNLKGYRTFFKPILAANPAIIGMVVVTGDSVLGCDLFATHNLLMQHADNIISSYATEVMTSGAKVTITNAKVQSYINNLLADEKKQEKLIKDNGTMLKENNNKLHIAIY